MVLLDQRNAIVRRKMKVREIELNDVLGGGGLTATFLNYLGNAIKSIYSIGQDFGGSIRRIATGKTCPL